MPLDVTVLFTEHTKKIYWKSPFELGKKITSGIYNHVPGQLQNIIVRRKYNSEHSINFYFSASWERTAITQVQWWNT